MTTFPGFIDMRCPHRQQDIESTTQRSSAFSQTSDGTFQTFCEIVKVIANLPEDHRATVRRRLRVYSIAHVEIAETNRINYLFVENNKYKS